MTKDTFITKEEKKDVKKFLRDKYATKLLRDKDCKDYLLAIISIVLGIPLEELKKGFKVIDIKVGLTNDTKNQETDVIALNHEGYYNIEINYNMSTEVDYKNMCYICNLVLRQTKPGRINRYKNILPEVQINLNNYDQFKIGKFIYVSKMLEETYKLVRNELIKIVDIDLDFLSKIDYTDIKKYERGSLEYLLYAFVCENKDMRKKLYEGDVIMDKVNEKLDTMDTNIDAYLFYDKQKLVEEASREQGYNEGYEEGMEKGVEKGESVKEETIIKNMLNLNYSLEDIQSITNTSFEKIEQIKNCNTN